LCSILSLFREDERRKKTKRDREKEEEEEEADRKETKSLMRRGELRKTSTLTQKKNKHIHADRSW